MPSSPLSPRRLPAGLVARSQRLVRGDPPQQISSPDLHCRIDNPAEVGTRHLHMAAPAESAEIGIHIARSAEVVNLQLIAGSAEHALVPVADQNLLSLHAAEAAGLAVVASAESVRDLHRTGLSNILGRLAREALVRRPKVTHRLGLTGAARPAVRAEPAHVETVAAAGAETRERLGQPGPRGPIKLQRVAGDGRGSNALQLGEIHQASVRAYRGRLVAFVPESGLRLSRVEGCRHQFRPDRLLHQLKLVRGDSAQYQRQLVADEFGQRRQLGLPRCAPRRPTRRQLIEQPKLHD